MPLGPILILLLLATLPFGLAGRLLQRLGLGRQAAVGLLLVMLVSIFVEIPAGTLRVNLGGSLLPAAAGVAILLGAKAGRGWRGTARTLLAAGVALLAMLQAGQYFPPWAPTELNLFDLDARYLYALGAGLAAGLIARDPLDGFAAGALSATLADLIWWATAPGLTLHLGGGLQATPFVAGTLAAWLTTLGWPVQRATGAAAQPPPGGASAAQPFGER